MEMKHDQPIKVGVVGCGFQGRLHIENLSRIPGVEVVAACDRDSGRLAEIARDFGIGSVYNNHRELLASHKFDLVTVCTMPSSHRTIVIDALEAGAHVMCEKPLASSATDALEMLRTARSTGRMLTVGFNMRFMTSAQSVTSFIANGELGKPMCARGFMLADQVPWWGRHYVEAESGGGALNSTAIHMLDLLMSLTGEWQPTTASASMARVFPRKRASTVPANVNPLEFDVEDLIAGHVRFASGFWLTIQGAWVWDEPGWNYSFDLVGDHGQAQLDPLRFSGERGGELVQLWPEAKGGTDFPSSVGALLLDSVEAIRDNRPPKVLAEEALIVQCVADALYESARSNREVVIELPHEVHSQGARVS
jgi:predicted dehydrogenase